MSELILNNNIQRKVYRNNSHFQRLSNLMEHPEYRSFFTDYMKEWQTAKTMIMFMKIYEAIEKHDNNLEPYEKISILENFINDSEFRKKLCLEFVDWTEK